MKRTYIAIVCQELFKASIMLYAVLTGLENLNAHFANVTFSSDVMFVVCLLSGILSIVV